ncbi:MAG: FecR domain-containing protein [Bdellovibrionaceae bacterium]|nr:FecR domain-containing protein [Pseudobdellovibrionaceae bacterium]
MLSTRLFVLVLTALCTHPLFAADEFGIFASIKGSVSVESAGNKVPAKVGEKIFQGSTVITGTNSRAKITMSDRSVVHVSPDSKLKIVAYSKNANKQTVELGLSQGKVRNEVKGSYDNNNKYLIKTPTAVAGVRGTTFVVNYSLATNKTEVATLQGIVELTPLKNGIPSGSPILIKKDQMGVAAAEKTVEAPQAISSSLRKEIDSEAAETQDNSANPTTTVGGSAPADKKEDSNKSEGSGSGAAADANKGKGDVKIKIGDSKDTAPDTFDPGTKMPNGPQMPLTPPTAKLPMTAPATRVNDAIRDKTDKTKVIIKPQAVPGN